MHKSCLVFLLYEGFCQFCGIFGRFGGHGRVWPPLDPPLKVMALRPRVPNTIYVYLQNLKTISALSISKK